MTHSSLQAGRKAGLRGIAKRVLPSGKFGRAVAVLAGGTLVAQLINVGLSPVFTRLYDPSDFGVLAVFGSLLALWGVAGSLRYELAIPLPEDDDTAANVAALAALCLVGVTLACAAFVAILGHDVAQLFNVPHLAKYLWLLPAGVLLVGLYQVFYRWALRKQEFATLARTRIGQSLARSLVQLALGVLRASPLGLILGQIVGGAWGTSTLSRFAWKDRVVVSSISRHDILRSARRYGNFPKYSLVAGVVSTLGLQAPSLLMAWTFGPEVAGWFAVTQSVIGLPMVILGAAVGESYIAVAPALARDNPPEFRRLFMHTTRRLLIIGILPTIALVAIGPLAFGIVFGEQWRMAGVYAALMAPAMLVQFAVSPMTGLSAILERQRLELGLYILRIAVLGAVFLFASALGWSPAPTVGLMSAAFCASYAIWFYYYYRIINVHCSNWPDDGSASA